MIIHNWLPNDSTFVYLDLFLYAQCNQSAGTHHFKKTLDYVNVLLIDQIIRWSNIIIPLLAHLV